MNIFGTFLVRVGQVIGLAVSIGPKRRNNSLQLRYLSFRVHEVR